MEELGKIVSDCLGMPDTRALNVVIPTFKWKGDDMRCSCNMDVNLP